MSISTRANRFSYQQLTLLEHETPGVARLRLNEPCISEPSPFRAVGLEQLIGGFGPPASGNIIHWRRGAGLLPGVEGAVITSGSLLSSLVGEPLFDLLERDACLFP